MLDPLSPVIFWRRHTTIPGVVSGSGNWPVNPLAQIISWRRRSASAAAVSGGSPEVTPPPATGGDIGQGDIGQGDIGHVTAGVTTGVPASIVVSAGSPQTAAINTPFAALQVIVLDSIGSPVAGVNVTFTAPSSGPSAAFAGGPVGISVSPTNSQGQTQAPLLTANGLLGSYAVVASIAGLTASFSLSNTAAAIAGILTGSATSSASAVNLTSEGNLDWEHWGDGGLNRKNRFNLPQTASLSDYAMVGAGNVLAYGDDPRPVNWTDGLPTVNDFGNTNGLAISGIGQGFSFVATADTTTRTLLVHVGGSLSGGTLTAHLSDDSAASFVDTTSAAGGQYDRNYTLTYRAASAGQLLTILWVMSSGTGSVSLSAAALSTTGATAVTATSGTPQSTGINAAFPVLLQATVTDAGGNPMSGQTVTFTAPGFSGSNPTGQFPSGGASVTANTDAFGVAVSPAFTANGFAGSFSILASVFGVGSPASFSLTNLTGVTGTGSFSVGMSLQGSGTISSGGITGTGSFKVAMSMSGTAVVLSLPPPSSRSGFRIGRGNRRS